MSAPILSVGWAPQRGEYVALLADGQFCILRNAASYEVAADGDLIVASRNGKTYAFPPGKWAAIGTYEEHEGLTYVAIEAFGEVVPEAQR